MNFTNKNNKTESATKVYDRRELSKEDKDFIKSKTSDTVRVC